MYNCKQCNAMYESSKQLGGHMRAMIKKGEHKKIIKPLTNINISNIICIDGKYHCPYCIKTFGKKGISSHIWRSHGDGINHLGGAKIGCTIYNKGLTKDTHPSIKKQGETLSARIKDGTIIHPFLGKKHTSETLAKIAKSGGYRKGSGRGKSGWYAGYWCDSTWELAWIIYHIDHDIKFDRNKEGFEYLFKGKSYKFYPDFIMPDGTYIEVKGYMDEKNLAKISQFISHIKVIGKQEIQTYLNYAISVYGKDYVKLYQK